MMTFGNGTKIPWFCSLQWEEVENSIIHHQELHVQRTNKRTAFPPPSRPYHRHSRVALGRWMCHAKRLPTWPHTLHCKSVPRSAPVPPLRVHCAQSPSPGDLFSGSWRTLARTGDSALMACNLRGRESEQTVGYWISRLVLNGPLTPADIILRTPPNIWVFTGESGGATANPHWGVIHHIGNVLRGPADKNICWIFEKTLRRATGLMAD